MHRDNITNRDMIVWATGISNPDRDTLQALGEAWDWLVSQGYLAVKPGGSRGWSYVTKRGKEVANDTDFGDVALANQRIRAGLHPSLDSVAKVPFLSGQHEQAVFGAFREIEIRVRSIAGLPNTTYGTDLMRQAFNKDNGPLTDTSLPLSERQAISDLFAGAMGAFKNPSSHRRVDFGDAMVAAAEIQYADLLMRILDQYEARINASNASAGTT